MGAIVAANAAGHITDYSAVEGMLAAAPHRGGETATAAVDGWQLGIAHQPGRKDAWLARDGANGAAVTGVFDNLDELRRALSAPGATPAEVAISAFQAWGDTAPARMRGAFAGCVVVDGTLRCFRDHLGLRPLFYAENGPGLAVATEAKQVAAGAGLALQPDMDAVTAVLYGRVEDETGSCLAGVRRLPKATVAGSGAGLRRYWHPERLLETARLSDDEVGEAFQELFSTAVRRMLRGRDTVSLSGGIDSPAVAAYAAPGYLEHHGHRLGALSAVFPDLPSVDESAYIHLVAERLGMDLHTYRPSAHALDDVERWTALLDGPVPTVSVPELDENYRTVREHGWDTVATGELAEFVVDQRLHLLHHLVVHGRMAAARRLVAQQRARGIRWSTIGKQLATPMVPARLAPLASRQLGRRPLPDWLDPAEVDREQYRADLEVPVRRRWLDQQLLAFPGAGVSIEADELVADLHGVDVRRPFADVDLWEFFLSLPAERKFPDSGSKALVKRLTRGRVPDEILDRRDKTVFNEHVLAHVDYELLRRLLSTPGHRLAGVRYERLGERLQAEDLGPVDLFWVRDLASVHAFLRRWES